MALIIVERSYENPVTDEDLKLAGEKAAPCEKVRGAKWLRSILSADRKRMICEYEAADADSVRESQRAAGLAFDRVWSGTSLP